MPLDTLSLEFSVTGGYWPSSGDFPPQEIAANTLKAGLNVHVKAGNKIEVANGTLELSTTNVGSRIFEFNDSRAEIAGNVANRLPFASLIREPGGVLLFLSELTGQQVYIDEVAVAGVTTSASAGILRIAIPNSLGVYTVIDAGFNKPVISGVTTPAGGAKGMTGDTGVALCAWRSITNAIGPPSEISYNNLAAGDTITIPLPAAASGQDGWVYAGTVPGDTSGTLRVVRYVYITPRGTFTATNGSANITAGVGTFFNLDLRPGDVVTIDGGSYTVATVTSNTTATLTTNFAGVTGAGKTATITSANAEWYASVGEQGELGSLIDFDVVRPPRAAGIATFFNRHFLFGTDAKPGGDVVGPGFRLMLPDNPEHVGLIGGRSESGTDILNALSSGDERSQTAYLMTRGALEIIQFTDDPTDPYRVRILRRPGFAGPKAGIVYENIFYGFSGQPLRTVINADVDVSFGQAVDNLIRDWVNPVVMGVDPQRGEVLFAHYNGATTSDTTVLPYIPRLGVWGPPILIDGQIDDFAVVGDACYATIFRLGVRRVHLWEGGSGMTGAYIGTQYQAGNGLFELESYRFAGRAIKLTYYVAANEAIATETSNPVGTGSETMTDSWVTHSEKYPNVRPGVGVAFRLDFADIGGNFERLTAEVRPKTARR